MKQKNINSQSNENNTKVTATNNISVHLTYNSMSMFHIFGLDCIGERTKYYKLHIKKRMK